jgi:hypothetical protein
MIITKEHQEALIATYTKEGHSRDECLGFMDGVEKIMELIGKPQEAKQIGIVNSMCEESLPPELFEQWLNIINMLYANRKELKEYNHLTQ